MFIFIQIELINNSVAKMSDELLLGTAKMLSIFHNTLTLPKCILLYNIKLPSIPLISSIE